MIGQKALNTIFPEGNNSLLSTKLLNAFVFFFLLLMAYWIMLPVLELPPIWDSGCFMYMGQSWLKGLIPYKDLWDHKGPMLYLLNAIGYKMGGQSGILFLQFFLTASAFYFLFLCIKKIIPVALAFALTCIGLFLIVFLHQTGNQTEQWALFFQGASLLLFFNYLNGKGSALNWLLMGFTMGCVFLIRPNQIAIWLIFVLFELGITLFEKKNFWGMVAHFAFMLLGFLMPVCLAVFYFYANNALPNMLDCFFRFNFIYAADNHHSIIDNIKFSLLNIPFLWVNVLCIGFNWGLYIVKYKVVRYEDKLLLLFASVWFLMEIYLSSLAGAYFLHYYLQWILPMVLCYASFVKSLGYFIKVSNQLKLAQLIFTLCIFFLYGYKTFIRHRWQMYALYQYQHEDSFMHAAVQYIESNSKPSDYVLEWGLVDGLNFMSNRLSPSKYFYPYALDTKGYTSEGMVNAYLADIKEKQPPIIVDASKYERFPCINQHERDSFYTLKPELKNKLPQNIAGFYKFVEDNYDSAARIGFYIIYKKKLNHE